jgi:hypothetical protein
MKIHPKALNAIALKHAALAAEGGSEATLLGTQPKQKYELRARSRN